MNEEQMSYWIAANLGDRLSRPLGGRWRLDGRIKSVVEIWMSEVHPRINSGELEISFPQNTHNMYAAFAKVNYAKYELEKEVAR